MKSTPEQCEDCPPVRARFSHLPEPMRRAARTARHFGMQLLIGCGVDFYIRTEDRRILEQIILPYFSKGDGWHRVLFVGCAWYTRGYRRMFSGKSYWTIEKNPQEARYGGSRHIVDSIANIRSHFDESALDVIVCNGVFGWGLDQKEEVERAFRGCFECLRPGGVFVLGWNDLPDHTPVSLEGIEALQLFAPFRFPPLNTTRHRIGSGRHIYDFHLKPGADR